MNEKYLKLTKQFNDTVSQLSQSPAEFNRFLRVAAFNYRLTFQNAVLAYAQDTGSDLLLTYDQWQSYRRVPKRHTKATLLFDVNHRGRYVVTFPMSRTVVDKRIHRYRELRLFDYRNDAAVVEALKAVFQTDADNLAEILYAENLKRFESNFDEAYPAFENETDFLAKAVTNMLMCRFGEEMPYKTFSFSDGINRDNIEHIYQMVIDVFRAEYAEIVTALPAELEKVREHKEDNELPLDDVIEQKQPHEQLKVFQVITNAGDDGGYDEKPEYATLDEAIQAGNQYIADGYIGFSVYNEETKRIEYVSGQFDVESAYSAEILEINQIPVPSDLNNQYVQGDTNFNIFDEEAERKKYPFFGHSEIINETLSVTPYLRANLDEIRAYFESETDAVVRQQYIRGVFNDDFSEVILSDGTRVGYKTYENGLLIWKGRYPNREGQNFLHWDDVVGHFEAMRMLGMLHNGAFANDMHNGQLTLVQGINDEPEKAFTFSQEVIDKALIRGSGIESGKFRIYEQFQKGLSAKENITFLKNEYGIGGCSEIIPYTGIAEDHNGQGILLRLGYQENSPRQQLTWKQVEKRIGELIQNDLYLNQSEKEHYPDWLKQQEQRRAELKSERELRDAVYQPSEPTKAAYSPTMQEYFKVKGENPDSIILFQIGAFYEAMGDDAKVVSEALELIFTSRRLTGDEGIEMCGFPENRLETNLNMLLDRGYSVGVSSVDENGNRSFVLMVSDRAHEPINSEPVGRIMTVR